MKIYIASSEKNIGKIQEDIYMRDAYRNKGFFSEITTLKDLVNCSESTDIVILKSIWGYHINYQKFLEEISNLRKKGAILVNDYDFIFWNIDKCKYLNEINHINVVPTEFLQFKESSTIREIGDVISEESKKLNADVLVIKPCISESGNLTFKYDLNDNNEAVITALKDNRQLNFIAQPYRFSVSEGEVSVIVINGVPLYGIRRFTGVFSDKLDPVHIKLADVPITMIREIATLKEFFLKRFGAFPNICRVDFIKVDGGYEILEVELIDPDLFFRYIPESMRKKVTSMLFESFANI